MRLCHLQNLAESLVFQNLNSQKIHQASTRTSSRLSGIHVGSRGRFLSNIRGDCLDSPKRSYRTTKCSGLRRLARQLPREPREPRARQPWSRRRLGLLAVLLGWDGQVGVLIATYISDLIMAFWFFRDETFQDTFPLYIITSPWKVRPARDAEPRAHLHREGEAPLRWALHGIHNIHGDQILYASFSILPCQFKHIMRHTTFMVTKSSIEVIQKPGNLHKIWVPLKVLNSLEPNWGDHIGVAVMLAPVAYIDHTTSPIRSCIGQCKNAVSSQFHFSQLCQISGWSQSTPSCSSGSPTTWDLPSFFPPLGFSTSWPTTAAGTMYVICFVLWFLPVYIKLEIACIHVSKFLWLILVF